MFIRVFKMSKLFGLNCDDNITCFLSSGDDAIIKTMQKEFKLCLALAKSNGRMNCGGLRVRNYIKYSYIDRPLITVITAVFNGADVLEQTILSVLNQSYDNIEYIIVDGGSTDGTLDIIRRYEDRIDYWCSEPDNGIYDAWNRGMSFARGEWIAFLGSDDAYYEHALDNYVRFIVNNEDKDYEYISSRVDLVTLNLKQIAVIGKPWEWSRFKKKMNVAHVGSLHRRNLFECYGVYDTKYKITGDYELLLRPRHSLRAGFLDCVTAYMRVGGASTNVFSAFDEAKCAKHHTGARSYTLCTLDNLVDMLKIVTKKILFRKYRSR